MVPDAWTNKGVKYTIDTQAGLGGIITAEKEDAKTVYSRIVSKVMSRDETEKVFEDDLAESRRAVGR
jgi:hypothetical protein